MKTKKATTSTKPTTPTAELSVPPVNRDDKFHATMVHAGDKKSIQDFRAQHDLTEKEAMTIIIAFSLGKVKADTIEDVVANFKAEQAAAEEAEKAAKAAAIAAAKAEKAANAEREKAEKAAKKAAAEAEKAAEKAKKAEEVLAKTAEAEKIETPEA